MDKEEYEDELDREWRAFLDKHKEEREFADKLAEYFNKKYEKYFKKEEEKYGAFPNKINDKIELAIHPNTTHLSLPWITIFNGMLTVGLPKFWSTERALSDQYRGNYKTFLKILDELEHKENWEKYKNDKLFENEIRLYEQADEIANEVNKKYGTNIVFHGGEDCGFDVTFSIRDKSEDEVIKEIERNIGPLYEANEKVCKIILGNNRIDFIFSEYTPKDVVERIKEKYKRKTFFFLGEITVILRYKLKYLPIILATSMLGPQKVGERIFLPYAFGKLKWTWTSEDQRIFEELKSKVETRIEKRKWSRLPYKGEQDHVFWSAEVLELKEVKEEIKMVRKGTLLSSKNEDDIELLKSAEFIRDYEKVAREGKIEASVAGARKHIRFCIIEEFYKTINDVKKQVGSNFLFALIWKES
ncbi:MAG: hypothetical protein ACP5HX_11585 [Thermoproteota archaeon]